MKDAMEKEPAAAEAPVDIGKLEWLGERHTVQFWLTRTAWKNLKNTEYGVRKETAAPNPALWDDPLLRQVYLIDLATFIASERVSVDSVSSSIRFAPDDRCRIYLATQALDEARHYEVFCKRVEALGIDESQREKLVKRYTTPAMRRFHDLIYEQVDKSDFLGSTIALNFILEGMAYPVYRYESKYWSRLDPGLSQLILGAFQDEVQHVGFGEAVVRSALKGDVGARNRVRRLVGDFHVLMREVFHEVISHYIGLYQEAANNYLDIMGDVEIFPGHTIARTSEEDQVRILLSEVETEHGRRVEKLGIT